MADFIRLLNLDKLTIKSCNKDEIICFENDLCTRVYLVKSGHIRISSTTIKGQEIIYKDLFANDMFGQNLLFSNNPYYRGDVTAVTNSSIIELGNEEFIKILTTNEKFLKEFLNYQSEDSKKLNQSIKILSIPTSEEKLLYLLQINHGSIRIKSITNLAKRLNISREATSRTVHLLIKQNKIVYTKNMISTK